MQGEINRATGDHLALDATKDGQGAHGQHGQHGQVGQHGQLGQHVNHGQNHQPPQPNFHHQQSQNHPNQMPPSLNNQAISQNNFYAMVGNSQNQFPAAFDQGQLLNFQNQSYQAAAGTGCNNPAYNVYPALPISHQNSISDQNNNFGQGMNAGGLKTSQSATNLQGNIGNFAGMQADFNAPTSASNIACQNGHSIQAQNSASATEIGGAHAHTHAQAHQVGGVSSEINNNTITKKPKPTDKDDTAQKVMHVDINSRNLNLFNILGLHLLYDIFTDSLGQGGSGKEKGEKTPILKMIKCKKNHHQNRGMHGYDGFGHGNGPHHGHMNGQNQGFSHSQGPRHGHGGHGGHLGGPGGQNGPNNRYHNNNTHGHGPHQTGPQNYKTKSGKESFQLLIEFATSLDARTFKEQHEGKDLFSKLMEKAKSKNLVVLRENLSVNEDIHMRIENSKHNYLTIDERHSAGKGLGVFGFFFFEK